MVGGGQEAKSSPRKRQMTSELEQTIGGHRGMDGSRVDTSHSSGHRTVDTSGHRTVDASAHRTVDASAHRTMDSSVGSRTVDSSGQRGVESYQPMSYEQFINPSQRSDATTRVSEPRPARDRSCRATADISTKQPRQTDQSNAEATDTFERRKDESGDARGGSSERRGGGAPKVEPFVRPVGSAQATDESFFLEMTPNILTGRTAGREADQLPRGSAPHGGTGNIQGMADNNARCHSVSCGTSQSVGDGSLVTSASKTRVSGSSELASEMGSGAKSWGDATDSKTIAKQPNSTAVCKLSENRRSDVKEIQNGKDEKLVESGMVECKSAAIGEAMGQSNEIQSSCKQVDTSKAAEIMPLCDNVTDKPVEAKVVGAQNGSLARDSEMMPSDSSAVERIQQDLMPDRRETESVKHEQIVAKSSGELRSDKLLASVNKTDPEGTTKGESMEGGSGGFKSEAKNDENRCESMDSQSTCDKTPSVDPSLPVESDAFVRDSGTDGKGKSEIKGDQGVTSDSMISDPASGLDVTGKCQVTSMSNVTQLPNPCEEELSSCDQKEVSQSTDSTPAATEIKTVSEMVNTSREVIRDAQSRYDKEFGSSNHPSPSTNHNLNKWIEMVTTAVRSRGMMENPFGSSPADVGSSPADVGCSLADIEGFVRASYKIRTSAAAHLSRRVRVSAKKASRRVGAARGQGGARTTSQRIEGGVKGDVGRVEGLRRRGGILEGEGEAGNETKEESVASVSFVYVFDTLLLSYVCMTLSITVCI